MTAVNWLAGVASVALAITSVGFSVSYGIEMYWWLKQVDAKCYDIREDNGQALTNIKLDSRRRRNSNSVDYSCSIRVIAEGQRHTWDDKSRPVGVVLTRPHSAASVLDPYNRGALWAADLTQAQMNCNKLSMRFEYDCIVHVDQEELLAYKWQYPCYQLVLLIIGWVFTAGLLCVCLCFGKRDSFASTGGWWNGVPAVKHSKERLKEQNLIVDPSQIGVTVEGEEEREDGLADAFRKLTEDDLVDEFIPGLKVRVLWPPIRMFNGPLKRWYSAVADAYDAERRRISVTFDPELTHLGKFPGCMIRPRWYKVADGFVRLHEGAMAHIARKKLLKGVVHNSLFNLTTFDNLDQNNNGFLEPEEVMTGLAKVGIELDSNSLCALFKRLDINGDGKIDATELQSFLLKG